MSNSQSDLVKEARDLLAKATPGPWFWNVNLKGRCVNLESQARGRLLETVMDFTRWGMGGAAPRFRDRDETMRRMEVLTVTVEGREHHAHWYQTIDHPDAALIARAPELLSSLCDEIEQLRSQHEVQADSIMEFQEEQRAFRAALQEAAIEVHVGWSHPRQWEDCDLNSCCERKRLIGEMS